MHTLFTIRNTGHYESENFQGFVRSTSPRPDPGVLREFPCAKPAAVELTARAALTETDNGSTHRPCAAPTPVPETGHIAGTGEQTQTILSWCYQTQSSLTSAGPSLNGGVIVEAFETAIGVLDEGIWALSASQLLDSRVGNSLGDTYSGQHWPSLPPRQRASCICS